MKDYVVSELSRKLAENDKRGVLLLIKVYLHINCSTTPLFYSAST